MSDAPSQSEPAAPKVRPTTRQWAAFAAVLLVTAALDIGAKAWALGRLSVASASPPRLCHIPAGHSYYQYQRNPVNPIEVVRGYFDLQYAENCGGAFGMLHTASESVRRPFFLLVGAFAIAFVVYLYRELGPTQKLSRFALPFVLGGAVGNLADRVRLGYVVDFLHAHWRNAYSYPTFNVADIAIVVGIGLMLLESILGSRARAPRGRLTET